MRILWHANAPWCNTGYGVQTDLFTRRLQALGHDVAISATYGLSGAVRSYEGMRVYPSDGNFGNRTLGAWAAHHAGDQPLRDVLVITLVDVWPLRTMEMMNLNLASWTPIHHDPISEGSLEFFRRTGAKPIAMSRYGEQKLRDAGLDPLYVPHGVDTSVYRPDPEWRTDFRGLLDIPENGFLVGLVANNAGCAPSRKAFGEQIEAFSRLRRERPDSFLYIHSEPLGVVADGVNIERILALHGVPDHAVRWVSPFLLEFGLPPEGMARLYNAMDVLLNATMGEGFGVPIAEAQACGTPVIVGGWTSMPELCGAGWIVEGQRMYEEGGRLGVAQRAFIHVPFVSSITDALLAAYDERHNEGLRAGAREFALDYDADTVTERYWKPALEALGGATEMPPVTLNRMQRRRAKVRA